MQINPWKGSQVEEKKNINNKNLKIGFWERPEERTNQEINEAYFYKLL